MEEELRMLINLALGVADQDKKIATLADKVEVLHRNQATLTRLINDFLEEKQQNASDKEG